MASETLTCTACKNTFTREAVRGQKPKRCPGCKGAPPVDSGRVVAGPQLNLNTEPPVLTGYGRSNFLGRILPIAALATTAPKEWWEVKCGGLLMHTFPNFQDAQDYREGKQAEELPIAEGGAKWTIVHCKEVA